MSSEKRACTSRSHLEQQLADLIFALGGGLVQRRELPQVGHVDRGPVSDQQLGHLVVAVRTGVVEGNQATGRGGDNTRSISLLSATQTLFGIITIFHNFT